MSSMLNQGGHAFATLTAQLYYVHILKGKARAWPEHHPSLRTAKVLLVPRTSGGCSGGNVGPGEKYKCHLMRKGSMVVEWSTGQLMRIAKGAVSISSLLYYLATWNVHLHIAQRSIYATRASPVMPVHRGSSTMGEGRRSFIWNFGSTRLVSDEMAAER